VSPVGDPARPVDFARLVHAGREAEEGARLGRGTEAPRIADGGAERHGGQRADARRGHHAARGLVAASRGHDARGQRAHLFGDGGVDRQQRPQHRQEFGLLLGRAPHPRQEALPRGARVGE
jgi:hypothetical protein